MKKLILFTLGICMAFTVSYAQETGEKNLEKFRSQLTGVWQNYLTMKEALVASDVGEVSATLAGVQEALGKVDMELLEGEAHMQWMEYLGKMNSSLRELKASDNLEAMRDYFAVFSEGLYQSIKDFGLSDKTAYYTYCPMARDNEGAHWLSDSKEIRNPYFGEKMLKCGKVKEELK